MNEVYGFTLLKTQEIPELNATAKLYRHSATGAEVLSMENEDENKVFGITFRTPPPDSTGLPHIMEHAVLCGSRKYPVKEPFIELSKGSLKTFLNAMTYSDKTCYPVASQNLQDFYNLVDVYLDAVFYPRITPETFQQEGWHYELNEIAAPLTYKGVVFNEMKGAYSSPDNLIYRYSERAVFPDNTYGFDSGGDPEVIPSLTYTQFKAFHETYYHPSNARIFFYGDDDPEARLKVLQAYLEDIEAHDVESEIQLHPHFDEPRHVVYAYPAGEDAENQKAMLTVNWLLPENLDPTVTLSWQILAHSLVGTPASPLRKALIDSGLGEEIVGAGLDNSLRQLYFSTGLKGIAVSEDKESQPLDEVEPLIMDTLSTLVEEGFDPEMIEASLNTVEFRLREQNFGSYPRGLVQMVRALTTWLHDGDPFAPLAFETPLAEVKARLEQGPYFERLIDEHLLQNPHRVTVALTPSPTLGQEQEAAEKARLAEVRAAMTDADLQAVVERTRRLKRLQETPDSPEALATIPRLTLEDLDEQVKRVPLEVVQDSDVEILYHDLFTNGILYLDVGFNLHTLPEDLLPYVSLFGAALLGIGTETEDFVKFTQRIGRKTGGLRYTPFTSAVRDAGDAAAWLFMRGKATVDQAGDLLDVFRDMLLTVKLDNRERFRQMLLEQKASQEANLIPMGHRVVVSRLRSKLNEAGWVAERIKGVDYLFFLRRLVKMVEDDWPIVLAKLEAVREILINRNAMMCNVTVDAENWTKVQPQLADFLGALPAHPTEKVTWAPLGEGAALVLGEGLPTEPASGEGATSSGQGTAPMLGEGAVPGLGEGLLTEPFEGLTIPAKVNYVAKGTNLHNLGHTLNGASAVIKNYLRTTWLWERIRVQGGAYGAFCVTDQHAGTLSYASYRDPNLLTTLANYDQTGDFLRNLDLSEDELTKSIIGAVSDLDAYKLPDAKGYSSMARYLVGYTDEARQKFRDEVLSTTIDDFKAFADVVDAVKQHGLVVVLGSQEAIESASADTDGDVAFEITKVL